ncbi:zinc finger CCCH domain-containing protein 39-like isoform X2 [Magnolia sinica]|uniref:zinc finger CCCH domain-containing protein 39-like isoform X2 n=1 Tax=Magnolia sinica TaxID=86752 RepID=UPI002659C4F4|nr:zinc finger CCCH domain-containing protein 39-like isoform X2 [Magnolia sinica]
MSAPAPPPPFFTHPFPGNAVGFGSQIPFDPEASGPAFRPEFPPFKKPRNSEDAPLFPIQNSPFNPRMLPPLPPPINKGVNKMFFKTRLCAKFKLGTCPYGSNCNFAHGIEEVRKPPANWQEIVAAHEDDRAAGNWGEQQRINRLGICRKFYNGEGCPYGDRCNFLHEQPERVREGVVASVATVVVAGTRGTASERTESNGFVNSGGDSNCSNQKGVLWKTRICNKWEMNGQCPFGDKCHFAHGAAELQKFGVHMEEESGNAGMAPSKPLLSPADMMLPSKAEANCKMQAEGRKRLSKWKGHDKISGIYGDWIDDIQLLNRPPSKVAS